MHRSSGQEAWRTLVFPPFTQHLQPVLGRWKMGTLTTSICGLILSFILTSQLFTVSELKLSLYAFILLLNSPLATLFISCLHNSNIQTIYSTPQNQVKVKKQCLCILLKGHMLIVVLIVGKCVATGCSHAGGLYNWIQSAWTVKMLLEVIWQTRGSEPG